jgi:hypothetical protein
VIKPVSLFHALHGNGNYLGARLCWRNDAPCPQTFADKNAQRRAQAPLVKLGEFLHAGQDRAAAMTGQRRAATAGVIDIDDSGRLRRMAMSGANRFVNKHARRVRARTIFLASDALDMVCGQSVNAKAHDCSLLIRIGPTGANKDSRRFARVGPFVAICLMAWVRDSKNGISYRSLKTSEGLPGRLPVAIDCPFTLLDHECR